MSRTGKLLLLLLLIVAALMTATVPTGAWFSDVLSGASYEFVIGESGT